MSPESTRRFPRVHKLFLTVFVACEGDRQRSPVSMGRIIDINRAGVGIEVFQELQVGAEMEMEIDLHDTITHAHGKVAYVRPGDEGKYIIGIEFSEELAQLDARVAD